MRRFVLAGMGISLALAFSGCGNRRGYESYEGYEVEAPVLSTTYIHKYGMKVRPQEWVERGQNGQVVSTLTNGIVVSKNYEEGCYEGDLTYTFPHSSVVERVKTYSQGQLIKEQENYPTGVVKQLTEYHTPTSYTITAMYENGTPRYREHIEEGKLVEGDYYTTYRQVESRVDQGNGTRTNRDNFGQLLSEDTIESGTLILRTVFYPNKTPKEVISYSNGRVNGQKKTFLPDGEPLTLEDWTNDKHEGITVLFQNGEKIAEVPYLRGERNGVELRFRDGISVVEEISWKNDKKHGPTYRHIGDDTLVEWYFNGRQIASETEYQMKSSRQF